MGAIHTQMVPYVKDQVVKSCRLYCLREGRGWMGPSLMLRNTFKKEVRPAELQGGSGVASESSRPGGPHCKSLGLKKKKSQQRLWSDRSWDLSVPSNCEEHKWGRTCGKQSEEDTGDGPVSSENLTEGSITAKIKEAGNIFSRKHGQEWTENRNPYARLSPAGLHNNPLFGDYSSFSVPFHLFCDTE